MGKIKKKAVALTIILFLCSISIAFGYVIGSSNLGPFGYPEFRGNRPMKPYSRDSYSGDHYSSEVRNYVNEANHYIEAAGNDIQRIREQAKKVRDDANDLVDEHNRFVRTSY